MQRQRMQIRDSVGTGFALLVGALVGVVLSAPALPRTVPFGVTTVTVSPAGAALLAGSFVVLVVPMVMLLLYLLVAGSER